MYFLHDLHLTRTVSLMHERHLTRTHSTLSSVEGLHFSNFDLGLLTLAGAVLSYFALVLYKNYLFDTSWRKVSEGQCVGDQCCPKRDSVHVCSVVLCCVVMSCLVL